MMKKTLIMVTVILLSTTFSSLNSQITTWDKTFGGTGWDYSNAMKQTNDGGFILAGSTTSFTGPNNRDAWLIKTDSDGIEEWNKTFDFG